MPMSVVLTVPLRSTSPARNPIWMPAVVNAPPLDVVTLLRSAHRLHIRYAVSGIIISLPLNETAPTAAGAGESAALPPFISPVEVHDDRVIPARTTAGAEAGFDAAAADGRFTPKVPALPWVMTDSALTKAGAKHAGAGVGQQDFVTAISSR